MLDISNTSLLCNKHLGVLMTLSFIPPTGHYSREQRDVRTGPWPQWPDTTQHTWPRTLAEARGPLTWRLR